MPRIDEMHLEEINKFDLEEMMINVVSQGLGYEAMKILARLLEERLKVTEMAIREMKATKRATIKILDSDISNKKKVEGIQGLWEER